VYFLFVSGVFRAYVKQSLDLSLDDKKILLSL
jgi:hypothetical protein